VHWLPFGSQPSTRLGAGLSAFISFLLILLAYFSALAKTYSFAILGQGLACANCKCVWLLRWLF